MTELYKPPSNPVQKNGFEKLGRSMCMEPPPCDTPSLVFFVYPRLHPIGVQKLLRLVACIVVNYLSR